MKEEIKARRKSRVRAKLNGTADRPRAVVFRSNSGIYVQFVDDSAGKTLLALDARKVKAKGKGKVEMAKVVGREAAAQAKKNKINKVVFDRSGYKYHGQVEALAEGMREGGLDF
jgi:large subunit ribosomal protein L18